MKRIVYTLAIGRPALARCALGLGRSLKLLGDTTRRVVVTDQLDFPWLKCFDEVLGPDEPLKWAMFGKLRALDRTDAEQVLAVDSDCLAFKRLGPIFDYCSGRGLCIQGRPITEAQWYGKVPEHLARHRIDAMPQVDGGMIYYERSEACQSLLRACRAEGERHSTSGFVYDSPLVPEEPYLSLALAKQGSEIPGGWHLIPGDADFMSSGLNPVGKLDLDVMKNRCAFVNRRFGKFRYVEPSIFHASYYKDFAMYWRQLDKLERLERYGDVLPR